VTCRQYLDLTFAPHKNLSSWEDSNLMDQRYHATAFISLHYIYRKSKHFLYIFYKISKILIFPLYLGLRAPLYSISKAFAILLVFTFIFCYYLLGNDFAIYIEEKFLLHIL
jgi:hypothetical protein